MKCIREWPVLDSKVLPKYLKKRRPSHLHAVQKEVQIITQNSQHVSEGMLKTVEILVLLIG